MDQREFEATLTEGQEVRLRYRGSSVPAVVEKVNRKSITVRVHDSIGNINKDGRVVVNRVISGRWSAGNCVRPKN